MDPRGLSAAAQWAFCQAAGGYREGLRGGRSWAPERDAVHRGGTRGGPGQHGGLCRFKVADAGEQDASPLRQGAREGARISARQDRCRPRTAVPVPLRSAGPPDRRPDSAQFGLVLDAVKAWPGSAATCRTPRATASLDCVSTRGRWRAMGRDEETGSQVEQRNWTQTCGSRTLTSKRHRGSFRFPPDRRHQKRSTDVLRKPDNCKSYRQSRLIGQLRNPRKQMLRHQNKEAAPESAAPCYSRDAPPGFWFGRAAGPRLVNAARFCWIAVIRLR